MNETGTEPKPHEGLALEQAPSQASAAIPRLVVFPPNDEAGGVDPLEFSIAGSLVQDISLTLCKSRLYEVIAPFTANRLAKSPGLQSLNVVAADYYIRTVLLPRKTAESYALLSLDVVATRSGESIYHNEIELRSSLLMDLHFGLCALMADRICGNIAREEMLQFRRTGAASAYVHYLLAMRYNGRNDLWSIRQAQRSLIRSSQLSPDYVPTLSLYARTKVVEWLERGTQDRTLLREAKHLAERAHLYDPTDSASLREIGHASLYLHDLDTALKSYERAHELAPNHADLLADQADVLSHASQHEEAERRISRALALNPLAPDDYYWIGGAISFFRGRYDEALSRLTTMHAPGLALRLMAASAAMKDDMAAATTYRAAAQARDPSFTVAKWTSLYPQPNPADTEHYLGALRKAGFP